MRLVSRTLGLLGVAAILAATSPVSGAVAQDGDANSAIGQLLTQVLPDVGLGDYLPDRAEAPHQADVDASQPFDNFDLGDPAIDPSGVMPLAISTGVVSPGRHVAPDDLFGEVVTELGPGPVFPPPIAPDRAVDVLDAFVPDVVEDRLRESAWLDDGAPLDLGSPPPPDVIRTLGPDLSSAGEQGLVDVLGQGWPAGDQSLPPFLRDRTLGPDSPLGCGPHDGYEVLCDPSDPGGSQFGPDIRFVGVELPAPIDSMGPPYEIEVVLRLHDPASDVYRGSFEGDLFNESNRILVAREGGGARFERLDWANQQWLPGGNASRVVVGPDAVLFLLEDSLEADGFGIATFLSTGVRQPGNVASYAVPPTTEPLHGFDPPSLMPPSFPPSELVIGPDLLVPGSPEIETWFGADPVSTDEPADAPEESTVAGTESPAETPTSDSDPDSDDGSNIRDIALIVVGGLAIAGGGYHLLNRNQTSTATAPEIPESDPDPIVIDQPADAVEVDAEDRAETPIVGAPPKSPYPRAQGPGSAFRNRRARELWEQTGFHFDPMAIPLPRLLQEAIESRPEPPTVITPEMAEVRRGMFTGAQAAGLSLVGKAMLTQSDDSYGGQPHMYWTVRVGPDGSILDSYENAARGGPAASAIMRIEVHPGPDGGWWSAVRLIDTTKNRVYVANNPESADPEAPPPQPETPDEAIRLALANVVGPDGKIAQPRDPRLDR